MGWIELIDALAPQDHGRRNLTAGLLVKAMILSGLGFIQRMPRFLQGGVRDSVGIAVAGSRMAWSAAHWQEEAGGKEPGI